MPSFKLVNYAEARAAGMTKSDAAKTVGFANPHYAEKRLIEDPELQNVYHNFLTQYNFRIGEVGIMALEKLAEYIKQDEVKPYVLLKIVDRTQETFNLQPRLKDPPAGGPGVVNNTLNIYEQGGTGAAKQLLERTGELHKAMLEYGKTNEIGSTPVPENTVSDGSVEKNAACQGRKEPTKPEPNIEITSPEHSNSEQSEKTGSLADEAGF